ncbi:hypothetical protein M9194_17715 [Vibrio sp. S4M6]|uniref:TackOD1 domain-containing metal-binding protein n=1 Tax=Vibrio sinus TaxID=2946865 RepID=UPI00202A9D34|nr:hypothetical protein [Vibrio sinus]MCL9783270.1 hypothetical protein [Vibrio sinus]
MLVSVEYATLFGSYCDELAAMELDVEFRQPSDDIYQSRGQVCIINLPSDQQDELLQKIHHSEFGWTWRIYTFKPSVLSPYLSDGLLSKQKVRPISGKLNYLQAEPKDKLLAYLWLDSDRTLSPKKDLGQKELYRYPLLDIYHNQERTPFRYLHRMIQLDIMSVARCVDRVRYCERCASGHLNYVDSCPSCSDIDIVSYDALHCFTCGHVDDASAFMKTQSMQCPTCKTLLKHIGVDYDRPLEMHHCNGCKNEFAEANVIAKCLSCDHVNDTHKLQAQTFYSYTVGENAQRFLFEEQLNPNYNIQLKGTTNVTAFEAALSWKNQLSIRHEQKDLLIGLKIENSDGYIKAFGDVAYIELIVQLSEHLEKLFRNTDLSCQYGDDLIFVLLPHFEYEFLEVVYMRLEEFGTLIESDLVELRVKHWQLPDSSLVDVKQWMKNRTSELND